MSTPGGVGHFISWDGGCLLVSRPLSAIPEHAHYALQVAFGLEPGVRFRPSTHAEWTSYDGVVIASRQPHAMDATSVSANVVIFIEPETREGRALTERFVPDGGIAALPASVLADVAPALFDAWQRDRSAAAVAEAARRVVAALTGGIEPSVVADPRIVRAIAYIKAHLDGPLDLETVAAEAFLSPSRFRHLFTEQTGMGLRPYVLWRRFVRVWELMMEGASLSRAAHEAGFADAAHLSRTSRSMFGIPPSALHFAEPLRNEARSDVR